MTIGSPNVLAATALGFFLLAGSAALAKKVAVVPGDRPIAVAISAAWKATTVDRGIQARTADEAIDPRFESYKPAQFQTRSASTTPTSRNRASRSPSMRRPARASRRCCALSVVPKAEGRRHLLVSYRASPEGDEKFDAETNRIMNGLAAPYDGR